MRGRLWASDTFVDFEHSLNSAIKKLRRALGDTPENSRYIETLPRLGYRFVAPVEAVSAAPVADRSRLSVATMAGVASRRWQTPLGIAVGVFAMLGGYLAWSGLRSRPQQSTRASEQIRAAPTSHESISLNSQHTSSSESAKAHDLYLKGLYFWNKRTVSGFHQAIEYFQQSTTVDPNYAPAYAGLANSYTLLTAYTSASAGVYLPQARAAAARALQLDDNLAEAHTALALIVQNHDWDWQTSETEYKRAIELDPNYATAHHWYAEHLMWLGRFDEALRESERARQLDPLSLIIATDQGAILYYSRQYDRAIEQFQSVLRKDPNFGRASKIVFAYVEKGMFSEAVAGAEIKNRLLGKGPWYWSDLAYIYGRAGQMGRARQEL
jgi:tetratricopeptide (TPR) repeat protein